MWGTNHRPNIRDQIQNDPIFFVDRLHEEYRACQKGYKEEKRDLIQKCAILTVSLQEEKNFKRIAHHPYWNNSRQQPKRNGSAKWAVYIMTRPINKDQRKVVGVYSRVINKLFAEGIAPDDVADAIKQKHGIPGILGQGSRKRNAKGASESNQDPDQEADFEEEGGQLGSASQTMDPEGGKASKHRAPALHGMSSDEEPSGQYQRISTSRKDTLFVVATPEQMRIAFQDGVIYIRAEVLPLPGTDDWIIRATDITRANVA